MVADGDQGQAKKAVRRPRRRRPTSRRAPQASKPVAKKKPPEKPVFAEKGIPRLAKFSDNEIAVLRSVTTPNLCGIPDEYFDGFDDDAVEDKLAMQIQVECQARGLIPENYLWASDPKGEFIHAGSKRKDLETRPVAVDSGPKE